MPWLQLRSANLDNLLVVRGRRRWVIDLLSEPDLFPGVIQLLFSDQLVPDLLPVSHGIIGAEGYDPDVGHQDANAALHHLLHVEGPRVQEVFDGDLEDVVFQMGKVVSPRFPALRAPRPALISEP